jgi:methionine-rich copper-binding protein CopC
MAPRMLARLRTALTLAALVALLMIGVSWGWSEVTTPVPDTEEESTAVCEDVTVAAGDKVHPDQVTVSVLNAGTREGLAGRTMADLVDEGLRQGQKANAPDGTKVEDVEIWTDDPSSPAVRLVATYLAKNGKGVEVVRREPLNLGVNVVVGDEFDKVVKGRAAVIASDDAVICSPPS